MVGEFIVDIIKQGKIEKLLMKNTNALTPSDRDMGTSMRQVAGCQLLITPMTAHVNCHIEKIAEVHCLKQRLQEQFLETSFQTLFPTP